MAEDAFLKDLGRDDAAKKEADVMDFIRSQQSNDGRADEDDDWDDALALRSFLKLPKHAKESLTQGTGGATSIFSDGSSHRDEIHGHRRESAVGLLSSQFGLGDATLDGKAWHEDDSVKNVGLKMDELQKNGGSSGSLTIDLFANSELTAEHIDIEEKPTVDEFGVPMEVYEKESEEEGLSSSELGAFSGSSSFMKGASTRGVSDTFHADFIAQRALMKKVAKEHVSITEKLEKAEKGVSEAAKHRIIEGFRRTIRGHHKKTRTEMLHRGWRHWRLFCDSFDHVQRGIEEGKYRMSAQALETRKRRRHLREWRLVVDREFHKRRYFVTQCEKLNTRLCRDALSTWRFVATENVKSRTEFNFVVTAMRKRLQKMRGNNTDLRWAWGRWHLLLVDLRHRDLKVSRALEVLARKTSLPSWALRRWRSKLINYPVSRQVALHEGALLLELVISKKEDLQLRQRMLRGFRIWASKVDYVHSIRQHTFSVLNSLLASAKRRMLHSRLLHWSRAVQRMRHKAGKLFTVMKLASRASKDRQRRRAFAVWVHRCKYLVDMETGRQTLDTHKQRTARLKERAAEAILGKRLSHADFRRVVGSWLVWKQRNFTQSRLRVRRALVLTSLRRSRLVSAMAAHALRRWRDVVLSTILRERRLIRLPVLLLKMHVKLQFARWRGNVKHSDAQQRIARWMVISRRVFRLLDCRKAFLRWRTRIRLDTQAERTLTKLFLRIPKVVYRSTLRRWSTRISRMKQYRANRLAIREPFDTWCKYARYWVACKSRLDYVVHMAGKNTRRHVFSRWTGMTRQYSRKLAALGRCVALHDAVVGLFKRRALGHWRRLNAGERAGTIENLGKATSLALRRVVAAEQTVEAQVQENSLLQSRVQALQEYQHSLLSTTCPMLANRYAERNRVFPPFHAWRRFVLRRKIHKHAVRSLVRNRKRIQVRHILSRRFRRWRQVLEFSLASSISERVKHGRFIVLVRRSRLSLLGHVFKRWRSRGHRFRSQLLGSFRRLTRQRCRRRLARAWLRWTRHIFAFRMVEGNLRRCVAMRRVFFAWHRLVLTMGLKRTTGHQLAMKMMRARRKGRKRGAFERWSSFSARRNLLRWRLGTVCHIVRKTMVSLAMGAWRRHAVRLTRLREFASHFSGAVSRLVAGHSLYRVCSAFHVWRVLLLEEGNEMLTFRYRREALRNVISTWEWRSQKGPSLRAFHHWRRVANEVSKQQFVVEGHFYHSVRERRERLALRGHFDAWLRCPRMQRALPIRAARAGAGLVAIQDVLERTHGFQRDLYSEVANDRSPSAALKLVVRALAEAFPLYLPSVYLLTGQGGTLSGLVSCLHADVIMEDDVAVEAPAALSSSDDDDDDYDNDDDDDDDGRGNNVASGQGRERPRKLSAASQLFPPAASGDGDGDNAGDHAPAPSRERTARGLPPRGFRRQHGSGSGSGSGSGRHVHLKPHSLRLGQGLVGRCAKLGLGAVFVNRAVHAQAQAQRSWNDQELPPDPEQDDTESEEEEEEEEEDGLLVGGEGASSGPAPAPSEERRRVSISDASQVQPFSREEPPAQTLRREELLVQSPHPERRATTMATATAAKPVRPSRPSRSPLHAAEGSTAGGGGKPPKPPKRALERSLSLSPGLLRGAKQATGTGTGGTAGSPMPPPPSSPLPERRQTQVGELLRKSSPHARRQSVLHSQSATSAESLSAVGTLRPARAHSETAGARVKLAGRVEAKKMKKKKKASQAHAGAGAEEGADRQTERADAVLFPLVRFGRVIGVVCLNHRAPHEADLGARARAGAEGEWVSEPSSVLAKSGSGSGKGRRAGAGAGSGSGLAATRREAEERDQAAAASLGGARMRGILSFVASHLRLTLAQSTTLSAVVFTTVDVFASYFSVSSIKAKRRRGRVGRRLGLLDSGSEYEESEAEATDADADQDEGNGEGEGEEGRGLGESKRLTLLRMEAQMTAQRDALQRELREVERIKEGLNRQVQLEQAHSTRVEDRHMALEQQLTETASHVTSVLAERDQYKVALEETRAAWEEAERERLSEIEQLKLALKRKEEEQAQQAQLLSSTRAALAEAGQKEERARETSNHMQQLHRVLKAASMTLSASDDENEDPSAGARGSFDYVSGF